MLNKVNQQIGSFDNAVTENTTLDKVVQERDQAMEGQEVAASMLEQTSREFARQSNQLVEENTALGKVKQERDQTVEEQNAIVGRLETADQETIALRARVTKLETDTTALELESVQFLKAITQQYQAMMQRAVDACGLMAELNLARLTNLTLQRSIYYLQCSIVNNTESKQQLLAFGQPGYAPQ
jgi:chromosome segregation ATPase